jgi:predicted Holliday junction resolvase-like endonuclease
MGYLKQRVEKGCSTINASNNAVESVVNNPSVILGKYTDLLILFLLHFDLNSNDVYFKSMRTISKSMKIWDIRKTTSTLRLEA